MGNHFSADLAETAQSVCDRKESVFVNGRNVSGNVPAVSQYFGRFIRPAKVALHDIRAAYEQQSRLIHAQWIHSLGIHDPYAYARQRVADLAALGSNLTKAGCPIIARIHGNCGRTL